MNHIPVLLSTVLDLLAPKTGETVLDVTVGLGGHAKGFLENIDSKGKFIGMDADGENLEEAAKVLNVTKVKNVELIHGNFQDIQNLLHLQHISCDILFADLGLSSPHLDDPSRGFRFRTDAPLDSRFDRTKGNTAADLLNTLDAKALQHIFHTFGELPKAQALTEAILQQRTLQLFRTTKDLVAVTEQVYGWRATKVLPQVFQALRIAVNDELGALQILLKQGPMLLKSGGRMGIISYHSLEDRMVKTCFRELTAVEKHPVTGTPLAPRPPAGRAGSSLQASGVGFQLLTKKAIRPTLRELEENPRARSARLRAIQRLPS